MTQPLPGTPEHWAAIDPARVAVIDDDRVTFLDGRLAPYNKPRRIEIIDQLPINPMGKVLENELRAPYWRGPTRNV